VKQLPLEGKSLLASFTNPEIPSQHREQYFEIFGNRALYKDGWVAAARRYAPWELFTNPAIIYRGSFDTDKWELYHVADDFSEAHDLADKYPDKLKELQQEFDKEARRNDVYPLVPYPFVGAPTIVPRGKTHFVYFAGVDRIPLAAVPDVSGRSHRITADIDVPEGGAQGVIVAEGGRYGGFSLYVKDGKLVFENNTLNLVHERVASSEALPTGKGTVSVVFTADPAPAGSRSLSVLGAGRPGPGTVQIFIGDRKVAEGRFSKFGAFGSSITETFDLGRDGGSPVSAAYTAPFAFTGKVNKVSIDLLN
jgi:arylsulfatase